MAAGNAWWKGGVRHYWVDSTLSNDESIRSLPCVCCKETEYLAHMETHYHPTLKYNPKQKCLFIRLFLFLIDKEKVKDCKFVMSKSYILPTVNSPPGDGNNNQDIIDDSPAKSKSAVSKIVRDAKLQYQLGDLKRKRSDTLFCKLVIGGSDQIILEVLDFMRVSSPMNREVLKWLMGGDFDQPVANVFPDPPREVQIMKLILMAILWFLLTPMMYVCHAIISKVLNSKMIKGAFAISNYDSLDFPLAFAVLSGKKEMLKIFLDYGIPIDYKDPAGYNVIHYLGDYSRNKSEKALKCYKAITDLSKEEYFSRKDLVKMITEKKSVNMRKNPLEYATQFGSPKFASELLTDTMIKTVMKVTEKKYVLCEDHKQESSQENDTSNDGKKKDEVEKGWIHQRMDITRYSGMFLRKAYNSYLLHLITARPAPIKPKESWWCVDNPCMRKWISLKFREWKWFVISNTAFEVVITLLLTFGMLMNGQGDMMLAPNQEMFTTAHVHIFLDKLDYIIKDMHEGNTEFEGNEEAAIIGGMLFHTYPELLTSSDSIDYAELFGVIRTVTMLESFNMTTMERIYDMVCVTGNNYKKVGDFVKMDNCTQQAADAILPTCEKVGLEFELQYMNKAKNETWDEKTRYEFVIATSIVTPLFRGNKLSRFKNPMRFEMNRVLVLGMLLILSAYFFWYLISDITLRITTLVDQILTNVSLYAIFATPLPGSYIKGQCNLFSSCGFIVLVVCLHKQVLQFYDTTLEQRNNLRDDILEYDRSNLLNISHNFFLAVITVLVLVSRVILHLHAMKLIPWVGMFVITTFQMATDLLQFAFLYMFIAVTFSILFHLFSRDDTCPLYRDSNNFAVVTSIFSAFALTFGHISINFDNIAVKLTYITYAVTSIILLLNLIIAVMSSTAANVVLEPWATQLYEENLLTEALGVEHWYFKYMLPLNMKIFMRNNAGFAVEMKGDRFTVGIDVFEEFSKGEKKEKEESNDDEEENESSTNV